MYKEIIKINKKISNDTVIIMISTYNRENKIVRSIESLLKQTYKNILIHIVDDNSSDNSINTIKEYIINNNITNIILTKNDTNVGIYENLNYILDFHKHDDYGYWTTQGSDDISKEQRIEVLINDIGKKCGIIHHYERKTKGIGPGEGLVLYKKNVFNLIGYYDNTRFSGDSEYLRRLTTKKGNIIKRINKNLYWADFDDTCLTNEYKGKIREDYFNKYSNEHRNGLLYRDYKKNN